MRIIAESTAIVLSILLAFAIDAWWDKSQDRKEEQQILVGLSDEFARHISDLDDRFSSDERRLNSMTFLMSYTSGKEGVYPIASLDSALQALLFGGTWDPTSTVLDATVASGRLELIQGDSLRNRLAQWGSIVAEVRDNRP